jgi:hypothetical protein
MAVWARFGAEKAAFVKDVLGQVERRGPIAAVISPMAASRPAAVGMERRANVRWNGFFGPAWSPREPARLRARL